MAERAQVGARVLVPFGKRVLTGLILAVHENAPEVEARPVSKLLDAEPVLDGTLLQLGHWIGRYYCAPLGEVLRSMAPAAAETTKGKVYELTQGGLDFVRQMLFGESEEEPDEVKVLRLLEARPMSASYLKSKFDGAAKVLQQLEKQGLVVAQDQVDAKDPLRASSKDLFLRFTARPEGVKLTKAERELLAFLELHPGEHVLEEVETKIKGASAAARSLGRRQLLGVRIRTSQGLSVAEDRPPHPLNPHQAAAVQAIHQAMAAGGFQAFLLQGVTGSGKTEVYLHAIEHALQLGKSALLLVPEIGLTPAVAGQFYHRFGDRVAILHSAFSGSERAEQYRRIRAGEAGVVVGTRSAVFAPVKNLGLILVDEEHDGSYKQQETPRYHGRDVAMVRGSLSGAVVVAGSATPSLESRYNVERGKYTLLALPERVANRPLPEVELVDMRQEFLETKKGGAFSRRLVEGLEERLQAGEQSILLLNRRGFSSFVTCRSCGERIECPNCAVTLTFHKRDHRLLCHYCNFAERVPKQCPKCQAEYLQFIGTGSERIEEEIHQLLPTARVVRMDRDTVVGKNKLESLLLGFREKAYDILVGTQMIAKGHDIPNVTFVGLINADIGLGMPDFRAAERTFQLLTQAAGRAGRGEVPGRVVLQTMQPDHYAIRLAATQDYASFYAKEMEFRRALRYPPFSALANVLIRHGEAEKAFSMSTELERLLQPAEPGIRVMGPAPAPVTKLKTEFRFQILIKATDRTKLNQLLQKMRNYAVESKWPATALVIDVDPLSLM